MKIKTYTNGNRQVIMGRRDGDNAFYVESNVWDGTKWHYGHNHPYKSLAAAERSAQKLSLIHI